MRSYCAIRICICTRTRFREAQREHPMNYLLSLMLFSFLKERFKHLLLFQVSIWKSSNEGYLTIQLNVDRKGDERWVEHRGNNSCYSNNFNGESIICDMKLWNIMAESKGIQIVAPVRFPTNKPTVRYSFTWLVSVSDEHSCWRVFVIIAGMKHLFQKQQTQYMFYAYYIYTILMAKTRVKQQWWWQEQQQLKRQTLLCQQENNDGERKSTWLELIE